MRYCPNCNTILQQELICPVCQLDCSAVTDTHEQEQHALNFMLRMMKYERLSWMIGGGVQLGLAVLLAILLAFLVGIDPSAETMELFLDVILYAGLGIVNLVLGSRITRYMDEIFCDVRPAFDRCTAVSTIVLAALFNEIAMIFVIINFATARSKRGLFGRIVHNQLHHQGGEMR
ncbi:MAG: hypothetical protein IJP35_08550 [Clostridia bacterium]|nr:hypothetical protein [Clostridia bacterium]